MTTDLPLAAIVCLAVAGYLLLVAIVLIIRYILVSRGVCTGGCPCSKDDDAESCGCCQNISAFCNCRPVGDTTSLLDGCCPKKQRLSCIDILLCQCCGGNEGAQGHCTCIRPYQCPVCLCPSECPKCPCVRKCDFDCSILKCFCLTVHVTCDRSHDHTSLSKVTALTHPVDEASLQNVKSKTFLSFTDLNDNFLPKNSSPRLPICSVPESRCHHKIARPEPRALTTENNDSSINYSLGYLPCLTSNRLSARPAGSRCSHFTGQEGESSKVICSESFTQTPRLLPVRRNTLHCDPPRMLITATDRYSSRSAKIYSSKKINAFNNRVCKGSEFQKSKLQNVFFRQAKTVPNLSPS